MEFGSLVDGDDIKDDGVEFGKISKIFVTQDAVYFKLCYFTEVIYYSVACSALQNDRKTNSGPDYFAHNARPHGFSDTIRHLHIWVLPVLKLYFSST